MSRMHASELLKLIGGSEIIVTVDEELAENIAKEVTSSVGVAGVAVKNGKRITWLKEGDEYLVMEGDAEEFYLHEKAARKLKEKWKNELPKRKL
ncbi:MAG: hypothetical protein QXW47_11270 [Candidatus Jordarchaeales archaeon]|nr:hypothetical protein [Candidatus Jordarchaeia archaeon]